MPRAIPCPKRRADSLFISVNDRGLRSLNLPGEVQEDRRHFERHLFACELQWHVTRLSEFNISGPGIQPDSAAQWKSRYLVEFLYLQLRSRLHQFSHANEIAISH